MHPDDAAARRASTASRRCRSRRATTSPSPSRPNDMFAKLMSISDELMWKLLRSAERSAARGRDRGAAGARSRPARNPRDAKVLLAKEITARFHGAAGGRRRPRPTSTCAPAAASPTRSRRSRSTARRSASARVLKQARLAPSTSEALRLVDGGGVRVDGARRHRSRPEARAPAPSSSRSASASSLASRCAEPSRAPTCRSRRCCACRSRPRSRRSSMKTAAWWITGSVGLLSDAMESLVNLASALFALAMVTIAARPADDDHPFGHTKAEYFSSGFEGAADRRRRDRHRLGRGAALPEPAAAAGRRHRPRADRRQLGR